jgi:hypothetical protein
VAIACRHPSAAKRFYPRAGARQKRCTVAANHFAIASFLLQADGIDLFRQTTRQISVNDVVVAASEERRETFARKRIAFLRQNV